MLAKSRKFSKLKTKGKKISPLTEDELTQLVNKAKRQASYLYTLGLKSFIKKKVNLFMSADSVYKFRSVLIEHHNSEVD